MYWQGKGRGPAKIIYPIVELDCRLPMICMIFTRIIINISYGSKLESTVHSFQTRLEGGWGISHQYIACQAELVG